MLRQKKVDAKQVNFDNDHVCNARTPYGDLRPSTVYDMCYMEKISLLSDLQFLSQTSLTAMPRSVRRLSTNSRIGTINFSYISKSYKKAQQT